MLELGYGHGHNVVEIAREVPDGLVEGIDHSAEMHALASALCAPLVLRGRVHLSCADSSDLLCGDATFAKAVAVHTLYVWPDPVRQLAELRRVSRRGVRLVLGFRPKDDEASRDFRRPSTAFTRAATSSTCLREPASRRSVSRRCRRPSC